MPNHITVLLEAPTEVLAALRGETSVDFDKIIPTPKVLVGFEPHGGIIDRVHAAVKGIEGIEPVAPGFPNLGLSNLLRTIGTPCPKEEMDLVARGIRAYKETGHAYWYDWNIANWGTKWNAYGIEERGETLVKFETAWSWPEPVLVRLSEMFPNADLAVRYADEDYGSSNCGTVKLAGGTVELTKPPEPLEFAYDVCGISEEDRREWAEG